MKVYDLLGNSIDRIDAISGFIDVIVNNTSVQPILETSSQSFRYSILTALASPPQDLYVIFRCDDYVDTTKSVQLSKYIPVGNK